jgi:hypothetical protein
MKTFKEKQDLNNQYLKTKFLTNNHKQAKTQIDNHLIGRF